MRTLCTQDNHKNSYSYFQQNLHHLKMWKASLSVSGQGDHVKWVIWRSSFDGQKLGMVTLGQRQEKQTSTTCWSPFWVATFWVWYVVVVGVTLMSTRSLRWSWFWQCCDWNSWVHFPWEGSRPSKSEANSHKIITWTKLWQSLKEADWVSIFGPI
jgi:hypothetical protein